MTVLGRGVIFQLALLACTYNNDTIITLLKKIDNLDSIYVYTQKSWTVQAKIIDRALKLNRLSVPK